jgi:hypothetical protein
VIVIQEILSGMLSIVLLRWAIARIMDQKWLAYVKTKEHMVCINLHNTCKPHSLTRYQGG